MMHIFGSIEPYVECNLPFQYSVIIFSCPHDANIKLLIRLFFCDITPWKFASLGWCYFLRCDKTTICLETRFDKKAIGFIKLLRPDGIFAKSLRNVKPFLTNFIYTKIF